MTGLWSLPWHLFSVKMMVELSLPVDGRSFYWSLKTIIGTEVELPTPPVGGRDKLPVCLSHKNIMPLVVSEVVVVMITYGAANDDITGIMTTLEVQCILKMTPIYYFYYPQNHWCFVFKILIIIREFDCKVFLSFISIRLNNVQYM